MRSFSVSYDGAVDVLYVSRVPHVLGEGIGAGDSLVLEFGVDNGAPSGVMVLGFERNGWSARTEQLGACLQSHLAVPCGLVRGLCDAVVAAPGEHIVVSVDDEGRVLSVSPPRHEDALSRGGLQAAR